MQNKYQNLYNLHDIDKSIVDLKQKIHEIPTVITQKQQTLASITEELNNSKVKLKQGKVDQNLKEVELKDIENKIRDLESKRWNLKTNQQLTALQHEIQALENKKDTLQNDIIQFLLSEEEEQAHVKSLDQKQKQESKIIDEEIKVLSKQLLQYKADLNKLLLEREEITKIMDEEIKNKYLLILKKRNGIAISKLKGHACTQCGMRIRPQIINEVRSKVAIGFCEGCNRILIYSDEDSE